MMSDFSSTPTEADGTAGKLPRLPTGPALSLLTLFAGAIRFFHLSHPCLWYDESMVFRRTCGSYGQLLDCLRTDGFVPLHYSLVWVISLAFKLTPTVLRFFPALCGTLMVPAVYFLARQLVGRNTSLLAAAFTACSAFMLFYSRDAKMYMDAWLFVTLGAGCLLWWFRSGRTTAWLCWIAAGCAACGLHFSSAIPLAISSLLLFTQSRLRWSGAVLWLIGIVIIFSGPVGYYEKFNRWEDRVNEDGWRDSGLQWIDDYNNSRTGPQLLRYLGTTMIMGWEWPKDADIQHLSAAGFQWPSRCAECMLGIFLLTLLPWPAILKPIPRFAEPPRAETGIEPGWRVVLWLSLWIVVPLYGFYCRSMPDFFSPLDWWHWLADEFPLLLLPAHHHWVWILIGLLVLPIPVMAVRRPGFRAAVVQGLGLLTVIAVLLGLCEGMAVSMKALSDAAEDAGKSWQSLWVPRYIGFIWPMLAVALAALLMRLPTRWGRAAVIFLLLAVNLVVACIRIFGQTEPPVDVMAADAFDAETPSKHTLCWAHLKPSAYFPGGANLYGEPGEYYLQLLNNKPVDPVLFRTHLHARQPQNLGARSSPWDLEISGEVNRIVIWRETDPVGRPVWSDRTAPPQWKLQSDQLFFARDCWIGQDLDGYQRTVYTRSDR